MKKTILNEYGVSEEKIFEIAEKNMQTLPKTCLDIKKMIGEESSSHSPEDLEMYAFKYDKESYGAAILMDINALTFMSKKLKGDFYIIPSSIHEIILVTLNDKEEEEEFIKKIKQDVKEVNSRFVEEQDILSYHVFKFSAEKRELICF